MFFKQDEAGQVIACAEAEAEYSIPRRFCNCVEGQKAELEYWHKLETEERDFKIRGLIQSLETGAYGKFKLSAWDVARTDTNAAEVYIKAVDYIDHVINKRTRRWLYLYGKSYGVGKTHMAVAIARKLTIEMLWRPYVAVWPEHCDKVKESWSLDQGEAGETENKLWGAMRGAGVLVLDDIDKADATPWAIGKLFDVINHRVLEDKLTIITGNHSMTELRRLWSANNRKGGAILSRINGQLYTAIEFTGEDQRWK